MRCSQFCTNSICSTYSEPLACFSFQSFEEYTRTLRDVLTSKAQCVEALNSQLELLEKLPPSPAT